MPEYPDITLYVEALSERAVGTTLKILRITIPFFLRTVLPLPVDFEGETLLQVKRLGKRIVLAFTGGKYAVIHLMIAGRLHWRSKAVSVPRRGGLAALDFDSGTLLVTESGHKRRASLHLVEGAEALAAFDRGGVDVFHTPLEVFARRLTSENHTLKRALTDPRIVDGIGNAYSDEILWAAQLSPVQMTKTLTQEEIARLYYSAQEQLILWTDRLRAEVGEHFPEHVTAFRENMAVHGKYGQPCPRCSTPVQRIRYAENETDYCPHCQTGDRLLSDRAIARLLRSDWPRTVDELEEKMQNLRGRR